MIGADKLANLESGGCLGIESQMKKSLVYLIPKKENKIMILPGDMLLRKVYGDNTAIVLTREELKQFAEELTGIMKMYFEVG